MLAQHDVSDQVINSTLDKSKKEAIRSGRPEAVWVGKEGPMVCLDERLTIEGVAAAGEFAPDGSLVAIGGGGGRGGVVGGGGGGGFQTVAGVVGGAGGVPRGG